MIEELLELREVMQGMYRNDLDLKCTKKTLRDHLVKMAETFKNGSSKKFL